MNLTKLFRKNSRMLVLVLMSALLVAFLLQDVISWLGRQFRDPNQQVGETMGLTVTQVDLQRAEVDLRLLASLGFSQLQGLPSLMRDPKEGALPYTLLLAEAKRGGVQISAERAQELIQRMHRPEDLGFIRDSHNRSLASIYEAAAECLSVVQYFAVQIEATGESVPRLQLAYRNQKQEAVVKLSVIDSKAFLAQVEPPTDAELQAAFEEGQDRKTAHTDDGLVFGYRLNDRAQVEYLTIEAREAESRVRISEREVRRYYDENKAKFMKEVPKPTTNPAETQPAEPQTERVPMSFEEAEQQVRQQFRSVKAVEEVQRLAQELQREASRGWDKSVHGEDYFTQPPPADKLVSFESLRDRPANAYVVAYGKTGLVDSDGLRKEQRAFSSARASDNRQTFGALQAAFRVKGLIKLESERDLGLNLLEPSPVFYTMIPRGFDPATRQMITKPTQPLFFRVLAVEPAGPPAALDAVREQVAEDVKLARAHALGGEHARRLADAARTTGLDAAVVADQGLRDLLTQAQEAASSQPATGRGQPKYAESLGPLTPLPSTPFTRTARSIAPLSQYGVFNVSGLTKQVFELMDRPSATQGAHAVVAYQDAKEQKWVVVEVIELKPIYDGDFAKEREHLIETSRQRDAQAFAGDWFDPKNIELRTQFVRATPRER